MTEYCRLCAELKDPDEIVASINDVQQSMEQKLRVCCEWTIENLEHCLPHSVCSICLHKLDKCWLFAQSVRLAQQRLIEIFETETKPLVAGALSEVVDSSEYSNSFPSTSRTRNDTYNDQKNQNPDLICEICSHAFRTSAELNAHRQQGCEGLIEIGSIAMDCKATAIDFTSSECDVKTDEIQTLHDDNDDGSDVIDDQSTSSVKNNANRCERNKLRNKSKLSQNKKNGRKIVKQVDATGLNQQYPCKGCDNVYSTAVGLASHHRHRHTGTREPRTFKCPLCDKVYKVKTQLSCHLISHAIRSKGALKIEEANNKVRLIPTNGDDPICIPGKITLFKCKECDKIFTYKNCLELHRARHLNDRQIECWLCHKIFRALPTVKAHIKTNHVPDVGKKNSICDLCGAAFRAASLLTIHMQSKHSDERPYKCEICGFRFKVKFQLKKHSSTHTGQRFKCNQCEKTLKSNYSLKQHLETHTGLIAKRFVCDICGIGFRRNMDLKDHRRIHTGERPYSCEHCPANFSARSSYYAHMRGVHGISLLARKNEKITK